MNTELITNTFSDRKIPCLEAALGRSYYFEDSKRAVAACKGNWDYAAIPALKPETGQQQLYDVSDYLKESAEGCRNFKTALEKGKRIYAFVGPRINKWKTDKDGKLILKNGGPILDLNDQIKAVSLVCAPYREEKYTPGGLDLRFISDNEILVDDRKKGRRGIYNTVRDEIEQVRETLKPANNQAVWYVTAEPERAEATAQKLISLVNALNETGDLQALEPKERYWLPQLYRDEAANYHQWIDWLARNTTHDKIPHSAIGAAYKAGYGEALEALAKIKKEEGTFADRIQFSVRLRDAMEACRRFGPAGDFVTKQLLYPEDNIVTKTLDLEICQ
jgi:hypothetical protein